MLYLLSMLCALQEYDFVFSVDIEEGKPPLKLPYNIAEDPWFAAKKFLDNNDLSPLFLDQVANFVVENTKGVTLTQTSLQSGDPFTGNDIAFSSFNFANNDDDGFLADFLN